MACWASKREWDGNSEPLNAWHHLKLSWVSTGTWVCVILWLWFFAAFFRFLLQCALMCDPETTSSMGRNHITPIFYRDAESHSGKTVSHHFILQYRTFHYNDSWYVSRWLHTNEKLPRCPWFCHWAGKCVFRASLILNSVSFCTIGCFWSLIASECLYVLRAGRKIWFILYPSSCPADI